MKNREQILKIFNCNFDCLIIFHFVAEIIMHEERVERHVAGVEEAVERIKNSFEATQSKLGEMSTQNKTDVFNLEVAFLNASKSKT